MEFLVSCPPSAELVSCTATAASENCSLTGPGVSARNPCPSNTASASGKASIVSHPFVTSSIRHTKPSMLVSASFTLRLRIQHKRHGGAVQEPVKPRRVVRLTYVVYEREHVHGVTTWLFVTPTPLRYSCAADLRTNGSPTMSNIPARILT